MYAKFIYYFTALLNSLHLRLRGANLVCGSLPYFFSGVIRGRIYCLIGFHIGHASYIMGNLELIGTNPEFYRNLELGERVCIGTHVTINIDAKVTIEDNVTIGPYVRIYTSTHDIGPGSQRCLPEVIRRPVVIERGSWIAMGAMILPGVHIGHGSVISAGAVVTKNVPPNSYVSGVPATIVQTLPRGNK